MKNFINKLNAVMLCSLMVIFTSCSENDYSSDIDSLSDRITAVESKISDIQSSITNGATISSVTSTDNGIKITLSTGESYEIENGTDGATGATGGAGTPGSVVEIVDGNWYIDGEDTGLCATGTSGSGTTGDAGADGAPGNYYKPDADTGTFVEYVWDEEAEEYVKGDDTGISFLASNDGITAVMNADGTVTISGFLDADGNPATATIGLSDITSILVSEESGHGFVLSGAQPYATAYYLNGLAQTALSSKESYKYVINPSTATAPESWAINFITADTKAATSYSNAFIFSNDVALVSGYATLTGKFDIYNLPAVDASQENRFYLQANVDAETTVSSNTATIEATDIKDVFIGSIAHNAEYKTTAADADILHSTVEAMDLQFAADAQVVATTDTLANLEVTYNSTTGINLANYVYAATYEDIAAETGKSWLGNYNIEGYTFVFSLPEEYLDVDNTNQQAFATLTNGVLKVEYDTYGKAAIDRTPIVKVDLMSDASFGTSEVIATAYIKVLIVQTQAAVVAPDPIEITMTAKEFDYSELFNTLTDEIVMDWAYMNQYVYNNAAFSALDGLTHTEFCTYYNAEPTALFSTGSNGKVSDLSSTETGTTSKYYGINIYAVTTEIGTHTCTITYESLQPDLYGDVVITQEFTIKAPNETLPEFTSNYVTAATTTTPAMQVTKGREVDATSGGTRHEMSVRPSEAFVDYLESYEATADAISAKYYANSNTETKFSVSIVDGYVGIGSLTAAGTDIATIQDQVLSLASALEASYEDIPMVFTIEYPNGYTQTKTWTIRFENPLTMTIADMKIATEKTATTLDVMDYVTFYFDGDEVYNPIDGWDADLRSKYGLSKNVTATISTATTDGTKEYLTRSGTEFTWNNTGTKPVEDFKGADVEVTLTGSYDSGSAYAIKVGTKELTILKYE